MGGRRFVDHWEKDGLTDCVRSLSAVGGRSEVPNWHSQSWCWEYQRHFLLGCVNMGQQRFFSRLPSSLNSPAMLVWWHLSSAVQWMGVEPSLFSHSGLFILWWSRRPHFSLWEKGPLRFTIMKGRNLQDGSSRHTAGVLTLLFCPGVWIYKRGCDIC